jgi:DNA polymerase-3 subunit epsilon
MKDNEEINELKKSRDLLRGLSFCIIDLETTGGNQSFDKIIEIGMVKIENLEITEQMGRLIDPEINIPDFIQKLTSIKPIDVKGAPKIDEAMDEILEFIGDSILVAHNITFDIPFLNSVLRRLKRKEIKNKVICTNVMTKYLIPEIMNSNLNYLSHLFGIKHNKAHRAIEDAKATAQLLLNFLEIYIEKGIRKVNQLYYPKNKFELDRLNFTKGHDISKIEEVIKNSPTPLIITIKGEKGVQTAIIPLQDCKEEYKFAMEIINKIDWEILTLKLSGPILEGLLFFNAHFNKFNEDIREEIVSYLNERYGQSDEKNLNFINQIDFVLMPHLIKEQFVNHSFLNLHQNTKIIFKYPAHKKKYFQYLGNQLKRYKTTQKEKKKLNIHKDLIPLFNNFLFNESKAKKGHYLFLKKELVKKDREEFFKEIEHFIEVKSHLYSYPVKHL